jgi:hypothetical protein
MSSDDNKVNVMLCEYNQIFSEIRTINSNISMVAKYYGGLLTSLIIYVLIGVKFYTASKHNINASVFYIYSTIGFTITLCLYFLGLVGSRQYAVSKKHRVRYWKSIHAIRKKISKLFPDISDCLILPKNSYRPNISSGEVVVPYIFAILNMIFGCLLFWFILIVVSVEDSNVFIDKDSIRMSLNIFLVYIIPVSLLLPGNCIYFSEQLYVARKISHANSFPKFPQTAKYKLVQAWKKHWIKKHQMKIIFFMLISCFLNFIFNQTLIDTLIFFIPLFILIILLGFADLYPYFKPISINKLCCFNLMPCLCNSKSGCSVNRNCCKAYEK